MNDIYEAEKFYNFEIVGCEDTLTKNGKLALIVKFKTDCPAEKYPYKEWFFPGHFLTLLYLLYPNFSLVGLRGKFKLAKNENNYWKIVQISSINLYHSSISSSPEEETTEIPFPAEESIDDDIPF